MSGTITFDDEFDTLSLHRTWQPGDKWQLIAPDSTEGRGGPNWGEGGTQWWVNPFNPNTPIDGIYSVSNGMLNLSLLPTPTQYQSYIDQQAGAHMPDVGALLNNSPTTYQHYGYWEMSVAVDRVPGFSFEISLENVQLTGHWPPQLNIGVSTDASGNQTLQAHVHNGSTSSDYSQPIDGTQQHIYGIDWEAEFITFYFDNTKILQVPNPGGLYQTDKMFVFLYTGGNYSSGTGVNPPASSLPANAHIDYFRVYDAKPHAVNTSLSIVAANANGAEDKSSSAPTVNVAGNRRNELSERLAVTLSDASAGSSVSTATIVNDDSEVGQQAASPAAATSETTGGDGAPDDNVVNVTIASDPTSNGMQFVALAGSAGTDMRSAIAPGQIPTNSAGEDTFVGYGDILAGAAAGIDGDTIINFGGGYVIDVTDLLPETAEPLAYVDLGGDGTLSVTDGGASINFAGSYSAINSTVPGADGHDGAGDTGV
jgi:hypothetical protein